MSIRDVGMSSLHGLRLAKASFRGSTKLSVTKTHLEESTTAHQPNTTSLSPPTAPPGLTHCNKCGKKESDVWL
jgi:hypothetical protein